MKPYQQRVVDELRELGDKIAKLQSFITGDIFKSLDVAEKHRLNDQLAVMVKYKCILRDRIAHFV